MSWLTKISDMAGKAEEMLNKIDKTTGTVIQQQRVDSSTPKFGRSSSFVQVDESADVHTEEIGRSGPSLPSRAHSEFAGEKKYRKKLLNEGFAPSTSVMIESENFEESLINMLNEDNNSKVNEDGGRSRRSSGRSVVSIQTTQSEVNDAAMSKLWAKDSQITSLRTKISDIERKLEKAQKDYYDMKGERDMLQNRVTSENSFENIEELKLARKKVQEQKDILQEECNQTRRRINLLEEEVRALSDQLRLAKFNLNENKKEFDEYKEKAQKILQSKEKLVESLKGENATSTGERPAHLLQAELEEMRVERDLSRADLEAAQLQLYNLRSDMEEIENQLREEKYQQSELRRQHLEERHSWQSSLSLLNEKIDCSKIENDFAKQEMKRQNDEFSHRLEQKESEIRRLIEQNRSNKRGESSFPPVDSSIREKLLQKQTELEEAQRNNQILNLRLERLQGSVKEVAISIEPAPAAFPVQNPTARNAIGLVDTLTFKFISVLRSYPASRLFVFMYLLLFHLWVFFIILTYTPESHDIDPTISSRGVLHSSGSFP